MHSVSNQNILTMSRHIGTIEPQQSSGGVNQINVTSFSGGTVRGGMVQLTLGGFPSLFAHLNEQEAIQLARMLLKSFGHEFHTN